MAKKNKPGSNVEVVVVKHKDKRANIPTRELADFVVKEENAPYEMLYPRDPSLDPQLVWKGKDQQERQPLSVLTVPIYIQEKIAPQAIIQDLRRRSNKPQESQPSLFSDFNGIEFEKLIEFYQHEQNWTNRMILGDSLLVMNSLAEKEGLKGKVQMIYIDPPYGIKFGSNWQVSTRKRDVKDGKAEDTSRQPEQVKAFRDTWRLGIHSYLEYLRERLVVCRELLTQSGSVMVQIGDQNVHLVRCVMDEVYGRENFVSVISYATTGGFETSTLSRLGDYIIWYAKSKEDIKYRRIYLGKSSFTLKSGDYRYARLADGTKRLMTEEEREGSAALPIGSRIFRLDNVTSQDPPPNPQPFEFEGKVYLPRSGRHWSVAWPDGMNKLKMCDRLFGREGSLAYLRYLDDFPVIELTNMWGDTSVAGSKEGKLYVVQTNPKVVERCILMATDPGDLVLDPTCGSGTTAYLAEQWARRWITIDTSRVALALARTRLMAARYPYYLLADSPEGTLKEAEIIGKVSANQKTENDIKKGFVYKRVPHVTLKSIANNPDIKEGMSQKEIDAAIARNVEMEILYDQPYEDNKRVRVSGPFTVESLSPHRVLTSEERPASEVESQTRSTTGQFEIMILENLKKAGVQNTVKKERLLFEKLEPYAGVYLHGAGEYTENGKTKRVAICIGPEHNTVGPELVKEAAKEAVRGIGFDLLVICGFAFDAHVSEEAKRYGNLTILMARMNPDLSMGEDLLKKTGAANLFMVFGEPDVKISKQKDGQLVAEIFGVDVYDPTTGQIRSHSIDDIACWFIDTDYNGESFFVRHAYFSGSDEPYEKLKRALRTEIDESAWSSLYSTKSRSFDAPATGKIAIKVINHYGDEVLKVFAV